MQSQKSQKMNSEDDFFASPSETEKAEMVKRIRSACAIRESTRILQSTLARQLEVEDVDRS